MSPFHYSETTLQFPFGKYGSRKNISDEIVKKQLARKGKNVRQEIPDDQSPKHQTNPYEIIQNYTYNIFHLGDEYIIT